jgi:hypothetical protein
MMENVESGSTFFKIFIQPSNGNVVQALVLRGLN